jgi:phosphoribosylanthranilate isomerase
MLKTQVKVSSVTNLSDARYCAGMGVEWIGFPLQEISNDRFTEIRNWLAGVQIVGEFTKATADVIQETVTNYQPDLIEIDSSVSLVAIQNIQIPKILRVNIDSDNLPAIFASSAPYVTSFLLVGDHANSIVGMEASIEIWAAQYPILLGLEIPDADLDEWIEQSSVRGIGLVAGKEDRPGYRDFTDLMTILEKLETE